MDKPSRVIQGGRLFISVGHILIITIIMWILAKTLKNRCHDDSDVKVHGNINKFHDNDVENAANVKEIIVKMMMMILMVMMWKLVERARESLL